MPKIVRKDDGFNITVEVQNFGQVTSEPADLKIINRTNDQEIEIAAGIVPPLKSFEKTTVELTCDKLFIAGVSYDLKVIINPDAQHTAILHRQTTPTP
jgi:hypothetical protein